MAGYAALGTILRINHFELVELTNITGPAVSADIIDVSSHGTGAPVYKEYVPGLLDGGDVSVEGNFIAVAQASIVIEALEAREEVDVEIIFPTVPVVTWSFSAIVTGYNMSAPHDGKIGFSATFKMTGQPVLV